ncbi:MAG TPA: hypothetical protein VHL50_01340 [Pyrinomonadaceae bacterium]|jgi:hypothetical protein|nr:hypothetical protein [Pyrinomonadaceae bacterium]
MSTVNTPANPDTDLWIDDQFGQLDTRRAPEGIGTFKDSLDILANENPEFAPIPDPDDEPPADTPVPEPVPDPAPAPTPVPDDGAPEVIEGPNGEKITIERSKKGWKTSIEDPDGGNPEVFYGSTQKELLQRLAVGKANATRQIRKLNRKIKIGETPVQTTEPTQQTATPQVRQLSADEIFQIKTELAADPDKALQSWFQKRTGLSLEQLVKLAQEGQAAKESLDAEAVANEFMTQNPDYYGWQSNFIAIVGYLSKNKLNRVMPETHEAANETVGLLYHKGFWTVQHLTEAYEELNESGLIRPAPKATVAETPAEPAPAPAAPAEPATPSSGRIVRTTTAPRAGLGIRTRETSNAPAPNTDKPLTAEEIGKLDDLSDAEVDRLMTAARQARAQARRQQ